MRRILALGSVLASLAFAACGGGSDDEATEAGEAGGGEGAGAAGASGAGATGGAAGTAGAAAGTGGTAGKGATGGSAGAAGGAAGAAGKGGSATGGTAGTSGAAGTGGATAGAAGTAGTGGKGGSATGGTAGASGTAGKGGSAGTGGASGTGGAAGGAGAGGLAICNGVAAAAFDPPNVCNGPGGNTTKEIPANNVYSTSWFGCYAKPDGTIVKDPTDNCEFACGPKGLCPASQPGPECESTLKWFAADADRYGCGARIRVTNCVNGKQVVLATLDRGPNCPIEKSFGAPVVDMSHDAMIYLFDGKTYGGSDKKRVVVEKVGDTTPLGPVP